MHDDRDDPLPDEPVRHPEPTTHPELDGYVPGEVGALRGRRVQNALRFVVVLAIIGLVLPGVLIGVSTAARTAELACEIVASTAATSASVTEARFEWVGAEGPGWYCYATAFNGAETQLRFLGFIPEVRVVPGSPGIDV